MKNDSQGMPETGVNRAYTMFHVYPVITPAAFYRPKVSGKY